MTTNIPTAMRTTEWYLWKSIQQTAANLSLKLRDISPRQKPPNVSNIPQLELPYPHNIIDTLHELELPIDVRQRVTETLKQKVDDLQEDYRKRFQHACLTMSTATFDRDVDYLQKAFQAIYRRQAIPLFNSFVDLAKEASAKRSTASGHKRPFNQQYSPFLEAYFSCNAYPSAADRYTLAQSSGMTARQIEVWFQNHRSRAKREGKTLQRNSTDWPLEQSMKYLEESRSSSDCPNTDQELSTSDSDDEEDAIPQCIATSCFTTSRPPHAFPTTYSASLDTDPFPNDNGVFRFPSPVWQRHAATSSSTNRSVPDLDELASMFASKLNLRNAHKRMSHNPNSRSAILSCVTIPSPAPHPSLVRAPKSRIRTESTSKFTSLTTHRFSQVSLPSPSKNKKASPFIKRPPPTAKSPPFTAETRAPYHDSYQSRSSSMSSLSSTDLETPPLSPQLADRTPFIFSADENWLLHDIFEPHEFQLVPINPAKSDGPSFDCLYDHIQSPFLPFPYVEVRP